MSACGRSTTSGSVARASGVRSQGREGGREGNKEASKQQGRPERSFQQAALAQWHS